MARYTVTMQVEYEVEADSLAEAYTIVNDGTEFPLLPHTEGNYCDNARISRITEVK